MGGLMKALIDTTISMRACRGWDGERGEETGRRAAVGGQSVQTGQVESHRWSDTHTRSIMTPEEEAEAAGSLLSGAWPEVTAWTSRRRQGARWTLQNLHEGEGKVKKTNKN